MHSYIGLHRPVGWLALVLSVAVVAGCGSSHTAGPGQQAAKKEIYTLEYYLTTPPGSADNFWIPVAKEMGYFAQEGIDLKPITVEGAGAAVSAGRGDLSVTTPVALLAAAASGNPLNLVVAYPWARRLHTVIAVPKGSPIKTIKDMKGARIAVHDFQQSQYVATKAALRMNGIDPDKDVKFITIPAGPAQVAAVDRREVDVIASFDTQMAQMQNLGLKVDFIPLPPETRKAFGSAFGFRTDYVDKHRDRVAGFGRAVAKATVFAQANPQAAVRLLWKYYPESKPKNVPDDQALEMTLRALKSRLDNAVVDPSDEVQKYGYTAESGFQAWIEIDPQWRGKKFDLKKLYDNRLVDEYNKFDPAEIVKQAKAFKG